MNNELLKRCSALLEACSLRLKAGDAEYTEVIFDVADAVHKSESQVGRLVVTQAVPVDGPFAPVQALYDVGGDENVTYDAGEYYFRRGELDAQLNCDIGCETNWHAWAKESYYCGYRGQYARFWEEFKLRNKC